MHKEKKTDIIIIGAGPISLATSIRLFLSKLSFMVLEKGESVGANILEWGHIHLFSNWKECIDSKSQKILNEYIQPKYLLNDFPTGKEFVQQYLKPLANLKPIKNNIQLNSNVINVNFDNTTKEFTVTYHQNKKHRIVKSKIVIDASGTWGNYNKLLNNQTELHESYCFGIPNSKQVIDYFQNSTIAIIGNGHSAMNSIDIISKYSNAQIYWILRSDAPRFGKSKVGGKSKKLEEKVISYIQQKRIQLITNFQIKKILNLEKQISLISEDGKTLSGINYLIQNIGANADYSFLHGITLDLDTTFNSPKNLANKIDPKLHTCNTLKYNFQDTLISEIDYYVIGMKSFGKASNFLLSSGYKILDELINHINIKNRTMEIKLRTMTENDWASLLVIYKEGLATGNATFKQEAPTYLEWDNGHLKSCRIVALYKNKIVGWAALSPVSGRCVYAGVAEVSVYVSNEFRGHKIGKRLLKELIIESEKEKIWTLQAGIFPENIPSIKIHEKLGFRKVGYREKIGQMNGVWRDTVLLEKRSEIVGIK